MLRIGDATSAIAWRRSVGFQPCRFGRWLDLLFMEKRLHGPVDPDG